MSLRVTGNKLGLVPVMHVWSWVSWGAEDPCHRVVVPPAGGRGVHDHVAGSETLPGDAVVTANSVLGSHLFRESPLELQGEEVLGGGHGGRGGVAAVLAHQAPCGGVGTLVCWVMMWLGDLCWGWWSYQTRPRSRTRSPDWPPGGRPSRRAGSHGRGGPLPPTW